MLVPSKAAAGRVEGIKAGRLIIRLENGTVCRPPARDATEHAQAGIGRRGRDAGPAARLLRVVGLAVCAAASVDGTGPRAGAL